MCGESICVCRALISAWSRAADLVAMARRGGGVVECVGREGEHGGQAAAVAGGCAASERRLELWVLAAAMTLGTCMGGVCKGRSGEAEGETGREERGTG